MPIVGMGSQRIPESPSSSSAVSSITKSLLGRGSRFLDLAEFEEGEGAEDDEDAVEVPGEGDI